jgi:glutamine cyclotransferase
VGADSIWVAQGFSVVSRLDPRTTQVQTQVDVAERPNEVAATANRVWATTEGVGLVVAIDPTDNSVVNRVKIGGDLEYLGGIAAGYDAVWVTTYDGFHDVAQLWRIDEASERVTDSKRLKGADRVAVGENSVWVTGDGTVYRIDPDTLDVTDRIAVPGAVDVAVGEGLVWVAVSADRSDRR